jgi:hypothetical protein
MRRLGYEGPEKEKALYLEHQRSLKHNEMQHFVAQNTKEWNKEMRMSLTEEALRDLPPTADPLAERNWVGAHPAMGRRYETKKEENVVITADDILNAPHGPAPSRQAVNMLRLYAQTPKTFYDQILSEQKKIKDGDKTEEVSGDTPEVAEIEALLGEIKAR